MSFPLDLAGSGLLNPIFFCLKHARGLHIIILKREKEKPTAQVDQGNIKKEETATENSHTQTHKPLKAI
jgi:hypothetical protein